MALNTIGYIANRAIEIAQLDSGFLPLARQYINLCLNNQASTFDWPYFRTQATDVPFTGGRAYALPTDYSRSDTCYLVDLNGGTRPITIISKYRFDKLISGILVSDPSIAFIDLSNRMINFNAAPLSGKSYRLTYFRDPQEYDDQGGDDGEVLDFENIMAIIYDVTSMLMDYSDDERAPMFQQKADKEYMWAKMNGWDEDNDPRIELGPSYKGGIRPSRGSFGGFWGL